MQGLKDSTWTGILGGIIGLKNKYWTQELLREKHLEFFSSLRHKLKYHNSYMCSVFIPLSACFAGKIKLVKLEWLNWFLVE